MFALDAKTGALLWRANVGGQASNSPITYRGERPAIRRVRRGQQPVRLRAATGSLMKRLATAVRVCVAALLGAVWHDAAESQSRPAPPRRPLEQLQKMSIEAEVPGLADPFRGITTNGRLESGLFSIRSTGVSTAPVRTAAEAFLAALSPAQRAKTLKAVDDPEWRKWMNQSFYIRDGAGFLEMTAAQREAAFALMRAGLSARGLKQTRDIMRLNETLAELNDNNFDELGEWQYFITVMGTPSATEPWGWQFDGHHAVINYFVLGDQVVMSPVFAGSEPVSADLRQVQGHDRAPGGTEQGAGVRQLAHRGAARQGHPAVHQDAGSQPERGVERQRRAGLCRAQGLGHDGAAARAARGPDGALTSAPWTTDTPA